MSVKFGLLTIHNGVVCVKRLDWLKVGPMKKKGAFKVMRFGEFPYVYGDMRMVFIVLQCGPPSGAHLRTPQIMGQEGSKDPSGTN